MRFLKTCVIIVWLWGGETFQSFQKQMVKDGYWIMSLWTKFIFLFNSCSAFSYLTLMQIIHSIILFTVAGYLTWKGFFVFCSSCSGIQWPHRGDTPNLVLQHCLLCIKGISLISIRGSQAWGWGGGDDACAPSGHTVVWGGGAVYLSPTSEASKYRVSKSCPLCCSVTGRRVEVTSSPHLPTNTLTPTPASSALHQCSSPNQFLSVSRFLLLPCLHSRRWADLSVYLSMPIPISHQSLSILAAT